MYKRTYFNSNGINFECWTGYNKQGFTHNVKVYRDGAFIGQTRTQYYNRTWESFQYERALKRAIQKFFGNSEQLNEYLNGIRQGKANECKAFVEQFKRDYESLHENTKEHLANAGIEITSMEQAKSIMAISKAFDLLMN